MKYFLVTSRDIKFMEDEVNEQIAAGWELQGGISISTLRNEFGEVLFAQAMVKKEA